MTKRGQATLVIFLALVLIVIIGLVFFIKGRVYIGGTSSDNLRRELDSIADHIENCLYESTEEYALILAKQGGYLTPKENTFRLYNDEKISYLCYDMPNLNRCSNRYLRLSDIEAQLIKAVNSKLDRCININAFEKSGYTLTADKTRQNLKIDIGNDNIITTLEYPIKLKKGDLKSEISLFSKAIPLPLGRLYLAARDIINAESTIGEFEPVLYSIAKSKFTGKPYIIQKLQPYPDKLYILKIKDIPEEKNPFIFQFFIEGEAR